MFRKVIVPFLLIAVFVLSGCTKDIHGGGVVTLFNVLGGQPGDAAIGLTFLCNDHKDMISGTLHWTDNTNGVSFTARLPWTPVSDIFGGVTTCEEAAAIADTEGASVNLALINTQGQQTGAAAVGVVEPGLAEQCGPSVSLVVVEADFDGTGDTLDYAAAGCLDRGKIVFQ
jgi:hypothetical protein